MKRIIHGAVMTVAAALIVGGLVVAHAYSLAYFLLAAPTWMFP